MNLFNKYGNLDCDDLFTEEIRRKIEDYIKEAKKLGASIIERRALEAVLVGVVTNVFAEDRLRTQIKMRKKEREAGVKQYLLFYNCPRCGHNWTKITSIKNGCAIGGKSCPECTFRTFHDKVERYHT